MPSMSTDLSPTTEQFIEDAIARGTFANRGELLEEAVELLKRREHLRKLIQEGIDELDRGEGIPAEEVFARLEAKADEMVRNASRKK